MRLLLDTNVCVALLRGSQPVQQQFAQQKPADVAVCSIVKVELFYGALHSSNPVQSLTRTGVFLHPFRSLPFDDAAAEIAGRIRADLAAVGMPISANDLLIAAIALANNLALVTHNTREFSRVGGLRLEDWQ